MNSNKLTDLSKFYSAGINYKKTDTTVRGLFAIGPEQYENLLIAASANGLQELFVLSTCNRTEIYGFADSPEQLISLLCNYTQGSKELFESLAYCKNGIDAIRHLFQVSAGLDSQILGDYEIVGQIRQAVKFARERKFIHSFMERIVNSVLQSSKMIKNETELSGGTVSVSFTAVQYIRERWHRINDKKILLLGVGKIGRSTCKNLIEYLGTREITLVNRTEEKAADLASELGINFAAADQLDQLLTESDIVLVATNAPEPFIFSHQLKEAGQKLILDLSIPCNVEKQAGNLENITLVDVDELSKLKDETLLMREKEVPRAMDIITSHLNDLMEWYEMRKHVPVLKAVKTKLKEIHSSPLIIHSSVDDAFLNNDPDEKIQRVINGMATKMRIRNQKGCHYIEAINEFIAAGSSN
ncbi:MAG: glutamyl-tRNA reductase [Bacteroidetes bacterium]|nr:MAG: glutamyl-tRNA reductase [Bacteroidota bacterium]